MKKEQKSEEYSFNIPSTLYNSLETDADKVLWKFDVENAFESGWDSAFNEMLNWLEDNIVKETFVMSSGYVHIGFDNLIKKFKEHMTE